LVPEPWFRSRGPGWAGSAAAAAGPRAGGHGEARGGVGSWGRGHVRQGRVGAALAVWPWGRSSWRQLALCMRACVRAWRACD
jgi:hypothetical protein